MNHSVATTVPWVTHALHAFIGMIEIVGASIIVISVAAAVSRLGLGALRGNPSEGASGTRLALGQRLVLALEFLIAADILKTVATPSLEELSLLGGTILIRTVLSLSIAYELRHLAAEKPRSSHE